MQAQSLGCRRWYRSDKKDAPYSSPFVFYSTLSRFSTETDDPSRINTVLVFNRVTQATQPGHPFLRKRSEYWGWPSGRRRTSSLRFGDLCFRDNCKKTLSPSRALRPIGRHWSPFPKALSQTPVFTLRDHGYGASVRAVCLFTSQRWSLYQIILLGDRDTCVWTTCLRSLHGSVPVRSRTCASELPQDYKSDTLGLPLDYRVY